MSFVDDREIQKLERTLLALTQKGFPQATERYVNNAAFKVREVAQNLIPDKMIQRSAFTTRSVIVRRSRGQIDVNKQKSVVGSLAYWLAHQEFGNTAHTREKYGYPIPTKIASGEGEVAGPRLKRIRPHHLLKRIRISPRVHAATRRQTNAATFRQAVKKRKKYVFMEITQRRKGIFKIENGKPKYLYNLSHNSVTNPKNQWLQDSVNIVIPQLSRLYFNALAHKLHVLGFR
jgi:hypothetical protein